MKKDNLLINAEYFPTIHREDIIKNCKYKFPIKSISAFGGGFAVAAASIAQATMTVQSNQGLYRCVFPEGVTGHLAEFKDGSGFLGTIMNQKGIAGQARWIPEDGASVSFAIDPLMFAIAAAMIGINKKLDVIQATQEEILQFLHQDKESELEGAVNSLSDILEQYHYNSDNEMWKGSKLTVVTSIKGKAEHNIIFYRKRIADILGNQKLIHVDQQTDKIKKELEQRFKYYQLSVYIYAYSSFLEVILGGNFTMDFLNHIIEKIKNYAFQYRIDYSKCYEQLEGLLHSSVQAKVFGGLGVAGKFTGSMIAKIPVISKGPVDEALIAVGEKIEKFSCKHADKVMEEFRNNRDAGIQLFIENIAILNDIGNKPVEVLFDNEELYICT